MEIINLFKKAELSGGYWFVKIYFPEKQIFKKAYILSLSHALELFPQSSIFSVNYKDNEYCLTWEFTQSDGIIVTLTMFVDKDFFNDKNKWV